MAFSVSILNAIHPTDLQQVSFNLIPLAHEIHLDMLRITTHSSTLRLC